VRALVTAMALVASARLAAADPVVDEATRLQTALDYEGALAVLDRALAAGGATVDEYAARQLLAGELAAGTGHDDVARDHYARALAVQPDLRLPDGTSPKLVLPFEAVRVHGHLALRARAVRGHDAIVLAVEADPLKLIAGIAVHAGDASGAEIVDRHAQRVAVPEAMAVGDVAALDAAGNEVWRGPASTLAQVAFPTLEPHRGKPLVWPFVVIAGVAAGWGGVSAWRLSVAQSEWNNLRTDNGHVDYSTLVGVQNRGEDWALSANTAFILTGVAAAVAVVQILRTPKVHVDVGPVVSVGGRF
jgi:hypothetical protein